MSLLVSIGYVLAAGALVAGLALRRDPRVLETLPSEPGSTGNRTVLASIGQRLRSSKARARVASRLPAPESARDLDTVMGTKALGAAAGFTSGLVAWPSGVAAVLVTGAILAAAGFALPDFVLARRGAVRRIAAAAAAPDLLDVLAIGVTAGLTPRLALERGAAVVEGPLAEELAGASDDLELGLPWRETLGGLVERTGSADLRRLATTLRRSERLGTPVAERLRALAREVREERRAREEERARRAPVIMLLPLVFLILPAFVVSAVVPALLVAARSIQ